jgi:hypothetical protein
VRSRLKPNVVRKFILVSNVLNAQKLSDDYVLSEYRVHHYTEQGFWFLKDPLFLLQSLTQLD